MNQKVTEISNEILRNPLNRSYASKEGDIFRLILLYLKRKHYVSIYSPSNKIYFLDGELKMNF